MSQRSIFTLRAYHEPFTVVIEPWASEFLVRTGEECHVAAFHPSASPSFGAELTGGELVMWVNEAGATFEFWRAGTLEMSMHVPIPG